MAKLVNRAKMTVASAPGTGPYALGAAVADLQTFAAAGVNNGDVVTAIVEDGANWQYGYASYSSTGPTLTFLTILGSSNGGAAISATSAALVFISPLAADLPSTGELVLVFGTTALPGTIALNGALLSRTAYAALWAYAQASNNLAASDGAWTSGQFSPGDGSTTFRIPDCRGIFLRGWDNGRGLDSGRAFGSYQADMYASHVHGVTDPQHSHGVTDPGHTHTYTKPGNAQGQFANNTGGAGVSGTSSQSTGSATTGLTVNAASTGLSVNSAGGAETAPKNVALLACIRY
jgi:microcystin-dependent protein